MKRQRRESLRGRESPNGHGRDQGHRPAGRRGLIDPGRTSSTKDVALLFLRHDVAVPTSRSPTRGADFVLILPTEVEQLLSTLAR